MELVTEPRKSQQSEVKAEARDALVEVRWKRLNERAEIPSYGSAGAACFDFRACLESPLEIAPGAIVAVPTGLAVELPLGYELQVRARSGLALKSGVSLVNGIGTVDADYRGEIKVILTVLGSNPVRFEHGDRIAQGLIARVLPVNMVEATELSSTERGVGGFGSTGKK